MGPHPFPPAHAAPDRRGRGAGRARVLPRLPAALRRGAHAPLHAAAGAHDLVGGARRRAGAGASARVPAQLELRRAARLRGDPARGDRDRAAGGRRRGGGAAGADPLWPLPRRSSGGREHGGPAARGDRALLPARAERAGRPAGAGPRVARTAPAGRLPRRARGRAGRSDRRRRRRRATGAARDRAQPRAGAGPRRLPRRRPAQARHADRRGEGAGQHRGRSTAHPGGGGAGGSDHRDPLGARFDPCARGARVPRPFDPGAHAADRVRAAEGWRPDPPPPGRHGAQRDRPPGARGARRGRARARAGRDGARPRRAPTWRARPSCW